MRLRHAVWAVLVLTGCLPRAVLLGDEALEEGRYRDAVRHYEEAQDGFLSPTELKHIGPRLYEAANLSASEDLAVLMVNLADRPREERLASLFKLWEDHRSHAGEGTELGAEISAMIDAEIHEEWPAVDALMKERKLAEGVEVAHSLATFAPPGSVYARRYEEVLRASAAVFSARSADAPAPADAFHEYVSGFYLGDRSAEAVETLGKVRHVGIAYEAEGVATRCPALPSGVAEPEVQVALRVDRCDFAESSRVISEDYTWSQIEDQLVAVERCESVQVGVKPVGGPPVQSCSWQSGAGDILEFWTCHDIVEQQYAPVYETFCQTVQEVQPVEVFYEGVRQVTLKTTTLRLSGRMSAPLPGEVGHSMRFDFEKEHVDRAFETPQSTLAFTEAGPADTALRAREHLVEKAERAFADRYREARAAERVTAAREGTAESTESAYAHAAMLGLVDADWAAGLGLHADAVRRALAGEDMSVPEPKAAAEVRPPLDLTWAEPELLLGNDAMTARGFASGTAHVGLVQRQVTGLEDEGQSDRVGLSGQLALSFSIMSLVQQNAWGFGYEDHVGFFLDFGAITSDPHLYDNGEPEGWAVGGLGLSYEGTYGWRSNHFGLRGGARLFIDTWGIGDIGANDAGIPLVVQMELRANERFPVIFEVYGLSPLWGWETYGGKVSVPVGMNATVIAGIQKSTPKIRFRETEFDLVKHGRHPSTVVNFGVGSVF
ncbi:MAG: hypothetical protein KC912_11295 [Proteobacteria bacterium]|nr:hypothetical protein [Pseudomonadota bacterium]